MRETTDFNRILHKFSIITESRRTLIDYTQILSYHQIEMISSSDDDDDPVNRVSFSSFSFFRE